MRAGAPVLTDASSAAKSSWIVVCGQRRADDLAREVGLDLELARGAVEHDADVLVLAHLRAGARGRAAAARRAARRRRAWSRPRTTPAISAPIALASETWAPRSTTVSAWRALTAASTARATPGADLLGALALVGREQHAEAVLVRVERLLQMADGDLGRDLDEVDDAAPVAAGRGSARRSPFWRSKSTTHTGRPGAARTAASVELERDGRRADAALGAGDRDQLAAERAGGRLLPRHALAQRARPLRGRAHAALELLERQRQRDDVAQPRLHGGAQQLRRVVGRDQDEPDLREGLAELAREVEHGHRRRARRAARRRRRRGGAARA